MPVYDPLSHLISQPPRVQTTHQETSQVQTVKCQKPTEPLE